MVKKTERKTYDWEAIEKDYRAGVLSIREIARQYGCSDKAIRNKAKRFGWERDLSDKIQNRVSVDLVRKGVLTKTNADLLSEKEIIDIAASTQVEVVTGHRKDIQRLRKIEQKVLAELKDNPTKMYTTQFQGEIVEKEYGLTVTEKASALNSISNTMQRRIQLERQAFGIADKVEPQAENQKPIDGSYTAVQAASAYSDLLKKNKA